MASFNNYNDIITLAAAALLTLSDSVRETTRLIIGRLTTCTTLTILSGNQNLKAPPTVKRFYNQTEYRKF